MRIALYVLLFSLFAAVALVELSPAPTQEFIEGRVTRFQETGGKGGAGTFMENAAILMVVELNEWRMQYTTLSQPVLDSLVYAFGWPLLMGLLTMLAFPGRKGWQYPALGVGLVYLWGLLSGAFGPGLFWFCVDVVVALANLLGLSYNGANGLIFAVIFPAYTALMLAAMLVRAGHGCYSRLRPGRQSPTPPPQISPRIPMGV